MKSIFYMQEGILILFGGGDAGGILITSHGIIHVPGNNPEVRAQLQEVAAISEIASSLVVGLEHIGNEQLRERLGGIATEMFEMAGKSVQAVFGAERSAY